MDCINLALSLIGFKQKEPWYKKKTLISWEELFFLLFICSIIYRCVDLRGTELLNISQNKQYLINITIIYAIASSLLFILWYFTNKPHKMSKDVVGIVFAIASENEKEKQRLISDFYSQVASVVQKGATKKVKYVFLNEEIANKAIEDESYRHKLVQDINATILLCGKIKTRKDKGSSKYVIEIKSGTVTKKLNPPFFSYHIAKESSQIIPDKTKIKEDDELSGFELYSHYIGYGIEFIVGLAYMYSEMFNNAYSMLSNCVYECEKTSIKKVGYIKDRAKTYKALTAALLAGEFIKNGNAKEGDNWINVALEMEPRNYMFLLTKSISSFLLGKIEDSMSTLNKCSKTKDYTWAYNKAFLFSYMGQLNDAYQIYKNLKDKPVADGTANDCDVFIENYLVKNEEKYELYYALGMIRYKIREDFKLAIDSFSKFVDYAKNNSVYSDTVPHIEEIIEKCKEHLKYKK